MTDARQALELADWRRAVGELYSRVRADEDPVHAHQQWRAGRNRLFAEHPQSPLHSDDPLRASGLPYWPYDPALRWTLDVARVDAPRTYRVSTDGDETTVLRQVGWIALPAPVDARLAVWWLDQYGGGIFLPIRDATAGRSSYGGGRYLLDTAKGADLGGSATELVVDLNFLYHPSCRYDPGWVCPLAPAENVLTTEVRAGERLPVKAPRLRAPDERR